MAGEPMLIVDDNAANLALVVFVLSREGYQVRTAVNATEALAALESFHPRIMLLDIQMPGMDGLELTRQLKANAKTRDIIVVAVTAYAMKGDEQKARAAGCDGYLTKPLDTRALPAKLREYLDR